MYNVINVLGNLLKIQNSRYVIFDFYLDFQDCKLLNDVYEYMYMMNYTWNYI